MKNLGIYVHVPFCASKCNYCDFNSYPNMWESERKYFDALTDEIVNKSGSDEYLADTVYIGGGTPSMVRLENIDRVFEALNRRFFIADNCEITIECNPATANEQKLRALRKAGINRISVGMQSANDELLKILGRRHSFNECARCVSDARSAGFDNLSLDLMFGLPNQDINDWKRTLEAAVKLNPEHISCYALKIEDNTPFAHMDLNIADDDESFEMYECAVKFLEQSGYLRYEISNFAKEGFESRHNIKYWRLDEYAGFGAGAHSFIDGNRFANERNILEYIDGAPFECIAEETNELMSEFVFLGLRMDSGVAEKEFKNRFGQDINDVFGVQIEKNLDRGTLIRRNGRLMIPRQYTYVGNAIMSDFV